jgi:hypothetical protein
VFGKKPAFVEKEVFGAKDKPVEASAFLLRDLTLAKAGDDKVTVTDGKSAKAVIWTVYPRPQRPPRRT